MVTTNVPVPLFLLTARRGGSNNETKEYSLHNSDGSNLRFVKF